MKATVPSALIALLVALPAQSQTPDPAVIQTGPHPQVVQHWRASYRFDCGELTVSVDLGVAAGRATVSAIDLGRGPLVEKLDELNEALEKHVFRDVIVTCTRTDPFPDVMFRTYMVDADDVAEPSSISMQATGRERTEVRLSRR